MAKNQKKLFKVECPWCNKPFHLRAQKRSNDPGEEQIVLDCPYCQKPVTVTVPKNITSPETIIRGIKGTRN